MFMLLERVEKRKETGDKGSSDEGAGKLRNGHAQTFEDTRINYHRVSAMPVVQMYKMMENDYNGNEISWDSDQEKEQFWNAVNKGLILAQEKLKKVQTHGDCLGTYAADVLKVLLDENLEIYPMTDDEKTGIYGQAAVGRPQISLEVNNHNGNYKEMAKTLIHEGFHIIGGCCKKNDNPQKSPGDPQFVADPGLDTACNSKDINAIYRELVKEKHKHRVRADAFAQYVMLY